MEYRVYYCHSYLNISLVVLSVFCQSLLCRVVSLLLFKLWTHCFVDWIYSLFSVLCVHHLVLQRLSAQCNVFLSSVTCIPVPSIRFWFFIVDTFNVWFFSSVTCLFCDSLVVVILDVMFSRFVCVSWNLLQNYLFLSVSVVYDFMLQDYVWFWYLFCSILQNFFTAFMIRLVL